MNEELTELEKVVSEIRKICTLPETNIGKKNEQIAKMFRLPYWEIVADLTESTLKDLELLQSFKLGGLNIDKMRRMILVLIVLSEDDKEKMVDYWELLSAHFRYFENRDEVDFVDRLTYEVVEFILFNP